MYVLLTTWESHTEFLQWEFPMETKAQRIGFLQQQTIFACELEGGSGKDLHTIDRLPFTLPKLCFYDFCHVYTTTVFHIHLSGKTISFRSPSRARLLELALRLEHYLQLCALLSPVIICKHGLKLKANIKNYPVDTD